MNRSEIEERARAEARVREELARLPPLRAEVRELEARTRIARRALATLAGSRLVGLLAGDGTAGRRDAEKSDARREADQLRRRRFRLSRRKRVLEAGAAAPSATAGDAALARPPGRPHAGSRPPSFCIRVAARDWKAAERGGDAALARSLARTLNERGHRALVQLDSEADDPLAASLDVLLVLRGRPTLEPTPGRINLLWQISHPDEADAAELNRYDRVLVASTRHVEELQAAVEVPVQPLLQFTDPAVFQPTPQTGAAHDLLFVGNWRGEFRRIVWDAIQAGRPPALYGEGWDLLAPEHAVAEHIPHAELPRLYSSCGVLLCDHWEDMRRHGFVSNRVFDALACGTFVLADDNPGLADVLPGAVPTYSTPTELGEKIERYLNDPAEREQLAQRGREIVLAEHTVEKRVEQLLAIVGAPAGGASAGGEGRRAVGAEPA